MDRSQEELLVGIDEALREQGLPIWLRPVRALGELSLRLGQRIEFDSHLALEVVSWFQNRYGGRLLAPLAMGRVAVELAGDVHVIRLEPRVLLASKKEGGTRPSFVWSIDGGPEFFNSLSPKQREAIRDLLTLGFRVYSELAPHLAERVLSASATVDLDAAIDELLRPNGPRLGQSKWASQQLAEKALKEYIDRSGGAPPKTHSIARLHDLACELGLPRLDRFVLPEGALLDLVACSPGARYGEGTHSLSETVAAHHAGLLVATGVAVKLRRDRGGRSWIDRGITKPREFVVSRISKLGGFTFQFSSTG